MEQGVYLPAGEPTANRSVSEYVTQHRFSRVAMSMLFAQAWISPVDARVPENSPVEERAAVCEAMGSVCIAESVAPDVEITIETTDPVIAVITTTTTMLPTTSTTTSKPMPVSCESAIQRVTKRVPVPPGWGFQCLPGGYQCEISGGDCDGEAKFASKTLIIAPDDEDSTGSRYHTVAHEIGHAWQAHLGIWTAETEAHSSELLEKQADDFAYAFRYRTGNKRGTRAGAFDMCQRFYERGGNVCGWS